MLTAVSSLRCCKVPHKRHTLTYLRLLRSEEHTSELQSLRHLVCRLLLEKKNNIDMVIDKLLTSRFNIRKHMPHNLEHLPLEEKIGVLHHRRYKSMRRQQFISRHDITPM